MKLKTLFTLSAVILLLLGVGLFLLPNELISIRTGQAPSELSLHIARQFGIVAASLGLITWLNRNAAASKERNALIAGLVLTFTLLPFETALSIFKGSESAEGWLLVLIFGLLALGFIISPERRNSPDLK